MPPSNTIRTADSGFRDDDASGSSKSTQDLSADHPLARKGYEIGTAEGLQVGDVFEFLWADSNEFEWEWKCLGYVRFIVLRHSDTFPHHAVCIPISVGSRHKFAKPGIDSSQQGFIFDDDCPDQWREKLEERNTLHFPPVGIELNKGKFRVKDDSRANYADIIEVDHDSQVIVVGTVVRYFDRLRRSVNKAVMRNILKKALSDYRSKRDSEKAPKIEPSVVGEPDEDEAEEPDNQYTHERPESRAESRPEVEASTPRERPAKPSAADQEKRDDVRATTSTMKLPQSKARKKSTVESSESRPKMDDARSMRKSSYETLASYNNVALAGRKSS
ncbi:hypothetical protein BKA67DRAFT_653600 [Truncatella angustata]|uniref:DUF6590 domain-containing protein n=1 Tax=Truncatella angustata TaxID=152316 RepID=A0A9P9A282_9PEZI|nr:uncharacterized protein BKA67DRAFT_653600 [Truncatella angustata]KAH6660421.1 hypothetical protein BKA67DRAFT_653600 [Truncatella angustata]KAH8202554.1 hypothetical protein TruAng_003265 [Truncatella angustata]